MQRRRDGTCRTNKEFLEQTNVQSLFGIPWRRLQETEAFGSYPLRGPWMATQDLEEIISECFSGMTLFSRKKMVKRTPYSDWRSMEKARTACGSAVHFLQDGPILATVPNSFDAGLARVIEIRAGREASNYFRAPTSYSADWLTSVTSESDQSALWITKP